MNKSKEQNNQRTVRKIDAACAKLIEFGMTRQGAKSILDSVTRQPKGFINFQKGINYVTELLESQKVTNPKEVLNLLKNAGESIKNEINNMVHADHVTLRCSGELFILKKMKSKLDHAD